MSSLTNASTMNSIIFVGRGMKISCIIIYLPCLFMRSVDPYVSSILNYDVMMFVWTLLCLIQNHDKVR